jgi:hypothetical protein
MFDIGVWQRDADNVLWATHSGEVLRGLDKLVQRVVIALLQEHSSIKYTFGRRMTPGCSFMTALRSGEVRSEMDVSAQFFLARHSLFAELKNDERGEDLPEECFRDVQCKGIVIEPGVLKLKLYVQSRVAAVTVWLPIKMPQ